MSQYFLDNLTFGNDTFDLHDTEARQMIANNTQNITALSARVTQNANDIDSLEETTAELREDLDSVEDRVTVNEGEIDALKTRTTSLEGRMNSAETRLDGHDTDIASLQNRMTAAEEDIDLLETRMLDAETDIDALEDRMDGVEQKNTEQDAAIDDLDDRVTQNTADIVDIKDDIDEIQDDIQDLDDRITASTYEAGIGIYFGQGEHHTNINVDDELLDQINQNTLDIDLLKTRVTNLENRVTTIEGDIVDIKGDIVTIQGDIVSIRGDITSIQNDITTIQGNITTINNEITQIQNDIDALDVRITALEAKALPAGGAVGQYLRKRSATDYDAYWGDVDPYEYFNNNNISQYSYPGAVNYKCIIENSSFSDLDISAFSDLIPLSKIPRNARIVIEQLVFGTGNTIVYATVFPSALVASYYFKLVKNNNGMWSLLENTPITVGNISSDGTTFTPTAYGATSIFYQLFDPNTGINIGYNTEPVLKISIPNAREVYDAFYNHQNGNITLHGIYSNITITNPVIKAFEIETNPLTGTLVSFTTKDISFS